MRRSAARGSLVTLHLLSAPLLSVVIQAGPRRAGWVVMMMVMMMFCLHGERLSARHCAASSGWRCSTTTTGSAYAVFSGTFVAQGMLGDGGSSGAQCMGEAHVACGGAARLGAT